MASSTRGSVWVVACTSMYKACGFLAGSVSAVEASTAQHTTTHMGQEISDGEQRLNFIYHVLP